VGRGALAGPVAAAAVILPTDLDEEWLQLVRDSKMLSPHRRSLLAQYIKESASAFGIGMVPPEVVDTYGIVAATRLAMQQAIQALPESPQYLLIDALKLPSVKLPQKSIIRGDRLCLSIACASILAKVARDELMTGMDREYPGYGFARHKGYGTKKHLKNLSELGPCPIHRHSFAPIRKLLGGPMTSGSIQNSLL
jgi:ribonuclease HII